MNERSGGKKFPLRLGMAFPWGSLASLEAPGDNRHVSEKWVCPQRVFVEFTKAVMAVIRIPVACEIRSPFRVYPPTNRLRNSFPVQGLSAYQSFANFVPRSGFIRLPIACETYHKNANLLRKSSLAQ